MQILTYIMAVHGFLPKALFPDFLKPNISEYFFIHKTLWIREVPIFKKSRYLKCQVMGSNTLLTGMFMQIFKPLALKQRSRGIAQFY